MSNHANILFVECCLFHGILLIIKETTTIKQQILWFYNLLQPKATLKQLCTTYCEWVGLIWPARLICSLGSLVHCVVTWQTFFCLFHGFFLLWSGTKHNWTWNDNIQCWNNTDRWNSLFFKNIKIIFKMLFSVRFYIILTTIVKYIHHEQYWKEKTVSNYTSYYDPARRP